MSIQHILEVHGRETANLYFNRYVNINLEKRLASYFYESPFVLSIEVMYLFIKKNDDACSAYGS